MRELIQRFRNRFSSNHRDLSFDEPPVDLAAEVAAVAAAESSRTIDLGKAIHSFRFRGLELRLDRDVLGLYRVTVSEGKDRRYSFTVVCEPGDYDSLYAAYDEITRFLGGNQRLADLPRHNRLKGHYYGQG